jgi:hypothetical protein
MGVIADKIADSAARHLLGHVRLPCRVGCSVRLGGGRSADPGDIEDPNDLRNVVGIEAQQSVPGVEDCHPNGRIIAGRQHRCIPWLIDQFNYALHQRVESPCR